MTEERWRRERIEGQGEGENEQWEKHCKARWATKKSGLKWQALMIFLSHAAVYLSSSIETCSCNFEDFAFTMAVDPCSACSVCLAPLNCWPGTEEWATPNLGLCRLLCGHWFHAQCLLEREVIWNMVPGSGSLSVIAKPYIETCPNCRASFHHSQVEHVLLMDVDDDFGDDLSEADASSVSGLVGEGEEPPAECHWKAYQDPETQGAWWSNILNETECFFEGDMHWVAYRSHDGRKWWCNTLDAAVWFFADTGKQE